jgi:spermidine dehydrogenase
MSKEVTRRDFLNGVLLASGGLWVENSFPLRFFTKTAAGVCPPAVLNDPRMGRGGNLPEAFLAGHWLRDGRLTFEKNDVEVSVGCDSYSGTYPLDNSDDAYDLLICGAGLAGLSTAFYVLRRRPKTRILILDANVLAGGNCGRDEEPPLPVSAATAGSYFVEPYADFQKEFFQGIGVDWEKCKIPDPVYSYFFDDRTPGVKKGTRSWNLDTYGKGLDSLPYSPKIIRQLKECQKKFREWADQDGAPSDPPDASNPKFDFLSRVSLDQYLTQTLRCAPIVSDFYTRYTIDALAGTAEQVNAHSAISFLGSEYSSLYAFPGGNSGIIQRLLRWLNSKPVTIRSKSMVLRADTNDKGVEAVYFHKEKFHRVKAKAAVLAGQSHTAKHVVGHLADRSRAEAWNAFKMVPVVVANVAIRSAAPLVDAGLGYNEYWWGSKYWADFVIADWVTPNRLKRDRPTVLTFFGGNMAPAEELAAERLKLMNTPFGDYEKSLREDLSRIMTGLKFDFDRDVTSIFLYRWGHGMILPAPGFIFGGKDRKSSPRKIACAPLGRLSFAAQDSEGTPSVESALASGSRAAQEVLSNL